MSREYVDDDIQFLHHHSRQPDPSKSYYVEKTRRAYSDERRSREYRNPSPEHGEWGRGGVDRRRATISSTTGRSQSTHASRAIPAGYIRNEPDCLTMHDMLHRQRLEDGVHNSPPKINWGTSVDDHVAVRPHHDPTTPSAGYKSILKQPYQGGSIMDSRSHAAHSTGTLPRHPPDTRHYDERRPTSGRTSPVGGNRSRYYEQPITNNPMPFRPDRSVVILNDGTPPRGEDLIALDPHRSPRRDHGRYDTLDRRHHRSNVSRSFELEDVHGGVPRDLIREPKRIAMDRYPREDELQIVQEVRSSSFSSGNMAGGSPRRYLRHMTSADRDIVRSLDRDTRGQRSSHRVRDYSSLDRELRDEEYQAAHQAKRQFEEMLQQNYHVGGDLGVFETVVDCKFKSYGCSAQMSKAVVAAHEEKCLYNPANGKRLCARCMLTVGKDHDCITLLRRALAEERLKEKRTGVCSDLSRTKPIIDSAFVKVKQIAGQALQHY